MSRDPILDLTSDLRGELADPEAEEAEEADPADVSALPVAPRVVALLRGVAVDLAEGMNEGRNEGRKEGRKERRKKFCESSGVDTGSFYIQPSPMRD